MEDGESTSLSAYSTDSEYASPSLDRKPFMIQETLPNRCVFKIIKKQRPEKDPA